MGPADDPTFDPAPLNTAQRSGDACIGCGKRWPRPRVRVGRLPDSTGVFACDDCAPAPPVPRPRRGPRGSRGTGAGSPAPPTPVPVTALHAAVTMESLQGEG
ncbi:hypothetical protein BJF79_26475 [Actinomadura sp. CNU-125]|uniref:hypothetical protein n=1 Tax=Actinomadura sp. CNU-125 TaxID=1904961 RepID=UPI000959EF86|nr:hypothetical protein [Actinomadura sp. CNU-125]OLT38629.1 hypothetical protein BJF79_26475 [Actinomadura sp. CNU-125]